MKPISSQPAKPVARAAFPRPHAPMPPDTTHGRWDPMLDGAQVRARSRMPNSHRRTCGSDLGFGECASPPSKRAKLPWLRRRDGRAAAPPAARDDRGTMLDRDVPCRPAAAMNEPAARSVDRRRFRHRTAGDPDQKERGFVRGPPEPRQIPRNSYVYIRAYRSRFGARQRRRWSRRTPAPPRQAAALGSGRPGL